MSALAAGLGGVLNWSGLLLAIPMVALVILAAWLIGRRGKKARKKPGMQMEYAVPGCSAAACRDILAARGDDDLFAYELEPAKTGGYYLHLSMHRPTQQPLDTLFQMQFGLESEARFTLEFVREAFGVREPIVPEALLDDFFAQKLGAVRCDAVEGENAKP